MVPNKTTYSGIIGSGISMTEKSDKSMFPSDQHGVSDDSENLSRLIDTQRWLMNNGFLNDMVKDQLYMYGAIVHKEIGAVEITVDLSGKIIHYRLYVDDRLLKKYNRFLELRDQNSILALWRFKGLLKKEGNLDFGKLINNFITDYLGPKWGSEVEIRNIADYVEGYENESEQIFPSAKAGEPSD